MRKATAIQQREWYSVTYGGIDAFSAQTTEQKRQLSLPALLRQRDDVHRRLIEVIENAPEGHLSGKVRFRRRLRLDTYSHYPKHTEAIRKCRERRRIATVSLP